jgi:RecB family exonuclease
LEQGRARFRQLAAALASTGQALGQVKELLEETKREWLTRHAADTAPPSSVNHRPERAARPMTDGLAATEKVL